MDEFKGKTAVITGGASGIGRSVALSLAKRGCDIVIADLDERYLENVRQEISYFGNHVLGVRCDVSNNADISNLVKQTISGFGTPDILMNNAGKAVYGNFGKIGISEYETILNINLLGVIRGVLAFLPYMLEKGSGFIINTSSQAGFYGHTDPYGLSKYALIGYSEGLYCDLHPKGLMVSVLCPAIVNTNLTLNSYIVGDETEIENARTRQMGKATGPDSLQPDYVAELVIDAIKTRKFLIITPGTEKQIKNATNRGRDYQKLENYLQNIDDSNDVPK